MKSVSINSRIVIIGDSIVMPRLENDVAYELTYAYRLKQLLPDCEVISRARRSNDTQKQTCRQAIYDDIEVFLPNIVILQLGIVDCAPRLFGKLQSLALNVLPNILSSRIIRLCSKYRYILTKRFPKVYVPYPAFKKNLNTLFIQLEKQKCIVVCVSIASTSEENRKKSYNFDENIRKYNRVLKNYCSNYNAHYLDFYSATRTENFLLDDGIHINIKGHEFLSKEISQIIQNESVCE